MKSTDANTTIVPGHGTLIRRDAMEPYRDMIVTVAGKVEQMIAQGKSLQEVLAAKLTAPFDANVAGGTESSAERFVGTVYQQLKGTRSKFDRTDSPRRALAGNTILWKCSDPETMPLSRIVRRLAPALTYTR